MPKNKAGKVAKPADQRAARLAIVRDVSQSAAELKQALKKALKLLVPSDSSHPAYNREWAGFCNRLASELGNVEEIQVPVLVESED